MLGTLKLLIPPAFNPKMLRITLMIRYAKSAMTSPTIAATIWLLAESSFVLSPPEVIHRIPPTTKKTKATSTDAKSKSDTIRPIIDPVEKLPLCPNWQRRKKLNPEFVFAQALSAYAGKVSPSGKIIPVNIPVIFLIFIIINSYSLACQEGD